MNEELHLQTLTVTSYEETVGQGRITLSPGMVQMVIARDTAPRQDVEVKDVQVFFVDGGIAQLFISGVDLLTLETAIGSYALPY